MLAHTKEKLATANTTLRDQITELKQINRTILEGINIGGSNLSEKIDGRLWETERNVEQANQKDHEAIAIRDDFIAKKKEFQRKVARLCASEWTSLMKIEEIERRLKLTAQRLQ